MNDVLIFTTVANHTEHLQDLFQVLWQFGLNISPHKCQFFRDKLIYMGLKFIIKDRKACYTPMKDKCDNICNLPPPKSIKEVRHFCGMVNFLSSFLPKLKSFINSYLWTLEKEKSI